jgi:2-(1,2-epoxy-1,2-dihydrophenyl)acetyl-CoA isomerase
MASCRGTEVTMASVSYQEHGPVAQVTLDRAEALNAFDRSLRVELADALKRAAASAARAVVLDAKGRGFSAGADLAAAKPAPEDVERWLLEEFAPGIRALAEMPKPVIAAVHGFASGIAVGYVLACDLVVMGESAFMQLPFARIGLLPDGGITWQLAQRLGHQRAFALAVDGERQDAHRCLELGLANKVVAEAEVLATARSWAAKLAQGAPLALAATKAALRGALTQDLKGAIAMEARLQRECIGSADFAEGVAAFLEKRNPNFTGR